jgi:hypothetical protein
VNALDCEELHFLLDNRGAIIAYQEKEQSWAGALAFSSEELARKFAELSHLDAAEIAAIARDDHGSVAALITALKLRPIRYLLLDLDYHSGKCLQVDFEGSGFGAVRERQFIAEHRHGQP